MKRRNLLVTVALAFGLIISPVSALASNNDKGGNRRSGSSRGARTEQQAKVRGNSGKGNARSVGTAPRATRVSAPGQTSQKRNSGNASKSSGHATRRGEQPATTRPGSSHSTGHTTRPGSSHSTPTVRPGSQSTPKRPGNNMHSAPRPGQGNHPVKTVKVPSRPPKGYGWNRPRPPRPPRPKRFAHPLPVFRPVLGLTFGSLLNVGLSTLVNAGYNVVGSVNNHIYLSNVAGFGLTWPQVTVYYDGGAMSGAMYHYSSMTPSMARYNSVYRTLCNEYGMPLEHSVAGGVTSVTWWGDNGYITLQYGPSAGSGSTIYATDIIYGL